MLACFEMFMHTRAQCFHILTHRAHRNGLVGALTNIMGVVGRSRMAEETMLRSLQAKCALCLWFVFANNSTTGSYQQQLRRQLCEAMHGAAMKRMLALCLTDTDQGRVQRICLKVR